MNQAVTTVGDQREQEWLGGWLHEKFGRSGSVRTRDAYLEHMQSFRRALWFKHATLESPPGLVATIAQAWAAEPRIHDGLDVAPTTHNLRLAVVSSFYEYLIKRYPEARLLNPIERVARRKVEDYASAQALSAEVIQRALADIDRSRRDGLRDFAFLVLAFTTGRRLAELQNIRRQDMRQEGERLTIHFPRCKGGKQTTDELTAPVSQAILAWLSAIYGGIESMTATDPLWLSLSNRKGWDEQGHSKPMAAHSIRQLCKKRLGISKVHVTRHSFAREMEESGAKVSDIAAALLHESIAVTSRYLARLKTSKNPHAEQLTARFGIH